MRPLDFCLLGFSAVDTTTLLQRVGICFAYFPWNQALGWVIAQVGNTQPKYNNLQWPSQSIPPQQCASMPSSSIKALSPQIVKPLLLNLAQVVFRTSQFYYTERQGLQPREQFIQAVNQSRMELTARSAELTRQRQLDYKITPEM